jgi:hypothetical protein
MRFSRGAARRTLSGMTPFPAAAPSRITPARLLLAAVASFVLAAVLIVGVIGIAGGVPIVAMTASIIGRVLGIASVVFVVLAVVRKLDSVR